MKCVRWQISNQLQSRIEEKNYVQSRNNIDASYTFNILVLYAFEWRNVLGVFFWLNVIRRHMFQSTSNNYTSNRLENASYNCDEYHSKDGKIKVKIDTLYCDREWINRNCHQSTEIQRWTWKWAEAKNWKVCRFLMTKKITTRQQLLTYNGQTSTHPV